MNEHLLSSALWYCRNGKSVIPVRQDKKPLIKWERYQQQPSEEAELRDWWRRWPDANVGLVTGAISDLTVVDCDTREGIESVEGSLSDATAIPTATTPRGGRHYYFKHQGGISNRAGVLKGVDVRTDGGYIIVPPSRNELGCYAWMPGCKISDVPPAVLPESLLIKMQTSLRSLGGSKEDSSPACRQASSGVVMGFSKGHRDETLFSIALNLAKGGMPADNIKQILDFFASRCDPPFSPAEVQTKIQSALNRISNAERNLAAEVRDWVLSSSGVFLSSDIVNGLQVSSRDQRKNVSKILTRLVGEGTIERTGNRNGQFRRIEGECERMDFMSATSETLSIWLPFKLHDLVETMPGNTILLSGEPNAGKTGLLLNIIRYNQDRFEIHYFNSEMGASELKKRLEKFEDISLPAWKFHAWERSGNFADVIKSGKGKINIIDFLELHDDFYRVGGMLNDIHRKLKGAIAIIALQKNAGTDMGLGGFRTLEKPRLALAMAPGRLKIVKAKNWKTPDNPNGKEVHFKIVQGCNLIQTKGWHRPEKTL